MTGDSHLRDAMRRCLDLARQGAMHVAPNPMVGAVIVRDGLIIGEGFHRRVGGPHAEAEAVASVSDPALLRGSTLVVNLEPCSHHGRTPPCAELVLRSGFSTVIIATLDPNPQVAGRGVDLLRRNGITVRVGLKREAAIELNRRFFTAHLLGRPYVILKWAETSDGFLARSDYSSRWISSEESRALVHRWRAEEQAIAVGYRTALMDNPRLTARIPGGKNPVRVVFDRESLLPRTHHLFDSEAPTIVVHAKDESVQGERAGLKLDFGPALEYELLKQLRARELNSILVEGGAKTLSRFIEAGLWDEARVFRSPQRFGEGIAAPRLEAAPRHTSRIGPDLLTEFRNVEGERRLMTLVPGGELEDKQDDR